MTPDLPSDRFVNVYADGQHGLIHEGRQEANRVCGPLRRSNSRIALLRIRPQEYGETSMTLDIAALRAALPTQPAETRVPMRLIERGGGAIYSKVDEAFCDLTEDNCQFVAVRTSDYYVAPKQFSVLDVQAARVAELEEFARTLSHRDDSIGDDARAALNQKDQTDG